MPNVVVIGAGIIGASVAYNLARRGVAVEVLEAERPAVGTTSRSFAWANANDKPPRAYHDLNAVGVTEHHRLLAELGPGGFHPTGNLEIAAAPAHREELRRRVRRLKELNYSAELVPRERAYDLAPGIALPDAADFAFFPEEGWVAAPVLVGQLLAAAAHLGVRLILPAAVAGLKMAGERVTGVVSEAGTIEADAVIDCTGPAAGRLLEPLGIHLGRERAPGLLVVSEPLPSLLDRAVHADDVYVRPDGAGRVLIGSQEVDQMLPPDLEPGEPLAVDSAPVQEMFRRGARLVPMVGRARIEAVRVGWRPMPAGGLSAVGPISGLAGYYLIFTHSGVTLGPILGRLVAEELTTGAPRPELQPFRPDRLVNKE